MGGPRYRCEVMYYWTADDMVHEITLLDAASDKIMARYCLCERKPFANTMGAKKVLVLPTDYPPGVQAKINEMLEWGPARRLVSRVTSFFWCPELWF